MRRGGTVRSLAVLGGGTALAAVCGLGFQSLMAYWFGAGAETDAFFMSLSIATFLAKFLMLSQLKSIALPSYSRLGASDERRAGAFAGGLLSTTLAVTLGLSAILFVAAPFLVDALAPGYEGGMRELTIRLTRLRIPGLPFLAGTAVGMALLESQRRFGITISAQKVIPAALSLVLLALVADRSGIVALGWISLATSVVGMLVVWLPARALIGSLALGPAVRDPDLRRVGKAWLGLSSSNAASFVGEWAFRIGASLLPLGLFSAVIYGRQVHDLLHAAINDSAQTVALPQFSTAVGTDGGVEPASAAAHARLGPVLRRALGGLSALSLPLGILVAATSPWSIALAFGRGRFLADGMLRPAAISLSLFLVGFFVQGLVQLLFAAAFATHRSDLVNRVQMIGHFARAIVILPMVSAFSYVGLVASQVAMNVVIFLLLLVWAPREWALIGRPGALARRLAAAAAPAALYLMFVASRLPDPLSVGIVGQITVLALVSVVWMALYAALAVALRVPGVEEVRSRLRASAPAGAAVVLLAIALGAPTRAGAQTPGQPAAPPGWSPVREGHGVLAVIEWLEARGALGAGASTARPLPAAAAAELLARSSTTPLAAGTADRFTEELGPRGLAAGWIRVLPALRADERGGTIAGSLAVTAESAAAPVFAFLDVDRGDETRVLRGGIGVRVGRFWAAVGRERVGLGGGATGAIVLNPSVHLDGLTIGTATPFHAGFLGEVTIGGGVGPLPSYDAVRDPWWGWMRATARPAPWIQVGLSRAALVGGRFEGGTVPYDPFVYPPDERAISVSEVLGVIAGRTSRYDDQVDAVDARVSLAPLGVPALAYAELGWEDASRSWGDPGLVAGLLLALAAPTPVSLGYEYAGFGRAARWCSPCDTLPAYWYRHTRFQSGWQAGGEPLGHPLGGYGREHAVRVAGWSPDGRIRADLRVARIRRDRWNLLEAGRPGSATRWEGSLGWRIGPRADLSAGWESEDGDGWRVQEWRVQVAALL